MIPILYEKTETAFISNGLGRLRDCISCTVTEERNGIYECDFQYPVSGANADLIQCGRIIGVTHDETGDIQPFDIVSYEKPIDGIVTWHCVHISYRQCFITATGSNINSLSAAFTLLGNGVPSNPFTYSTDKTSSGYFAAADGLPHSVREMLGGIEGSILDAYGGEYEWNKWEVILHSARGRSTDFAIRYGVNMTEFNDQTDYNGCYSSCVPYWTDGTAKVVGSMVSASGTTITGRGECVPLDVSEKFESKPTKAQVQNAGISYMNTNNTFMPAQTITVEFLRLQDVGEFETVQTLMQCKLCDTVQVIFPDYNMQGTFKIVKTVWDALQGRYESMELGTLSVSLADALGITNALDRQLLIPDITATNGHIQIGTIHICWGFETFTSTANAYTETTVTMPYTYLSSPTVFTSAANRSAQVRTVYGTQGDLAGDKLYLGVYATAARSVTVCWLAIGT